MRFWILLLLASVSLANVVKRQAGDDEIAGAFEESAAPAEDEGATVEAEDNADGNVELESEHDEQTEGEEQPAQEESPIEENEEEEQTEENPEATVEGEEQVTEEEGSTDEEVAVPAQENIEAEIQEETEEPATEADETEQPAGTEPTEEETSDSTGQVLPPTIDTDAPKAETAAEAASETPITDEFGWIHYPWKKFPISKQRYTKTKDCGCQIKWIKRVYKRYQPKPKVILTHSSSYYHPRRRCHHNHKPCPCRRHRHHHHVFHRKPTRTVQNVVIHHVPKPCFNKPIVRHITKFHHRHGRFHGHGQF